MAEQTVRIVSKHGLHARPAALFARAATAAAMPVQLVMGGKSVNAASILGVLSLGVDHGDEVTVTANGDGADRVVAELVALLLTDFEVN